METSKKCKTIKITDDQQEYPLDLFCIPPHYNTALESVLIPNGMILDRVARMAKDIINDLDDRSMHVLCMLKGGFKFFGDLVECMAGNNRNTAKSVRIGVDFIRLKSYVDDKSTGQVQVIGIDDLSSLTGKNVLVVEDIVDTGRTMKKLLGLLSDVKPKSIKVASLLVKRREGCLYVPDYAGFEVPDKFVVGYALDYNEYFRDLDHLCVMSESGIKEYAVQQ
ncbi:Hypoxanthine-guanine phosphoribosyltransferase [Trichoplax sp. H2]|nr:Hypoxanthine-guanine phosphoribosyltransferase [Trichoplax sp. H2]|eukprot:RDD40187.1 Hypoxanthine-guanine phosphoribosyltransferase [Trichoplax sp. H2]